MDRALKERIIGAVVLVVIVVLVVPVFLDGPASDEEMISKPVILPGQSREPGTRKTVVLQRDRDEPLPDTPPRSGAHPVETAAARRTPATNAESDDARPAPPASAGTAESETVAAAEAPEPEPDPPPARQEQSEAPAVKPTPAAADSSTGMWAVQLGSFSNKANADRLAASLREDGYAAFLSQHRTASGELHRVRIGPQEDRESAEAVAARLGAKGLKGQVVPHP